MHQIQTKPNAKIKRRWLANRVTEYISNTTNENPQYKSTQFNLFVFPVFYINTNYLKSNWKEKPPVIPIRLNKPFGCFKGSGSFKTMVW